MFAIGHQWQKSSFDALFLYIVKDRGLYEKSFFYIFAILIVLSLPLTTFATTTSDKCDLVDLACEVFPEYAELINESKRAAGTFAHSNEPLNIVFSKTRKISDGTSLSISQVTSGEVIIVRTITGYTVNKTNSSVSNVGSDIIGSTTFEVTSTIGYGTFRLTSVGFIIHQNGSGNFASYGTPSTTTEASYSALSRSSTYIHYMLRFNPGRNIDFDVSFSNGKVVGRVYA